ncbi:MAG: hypothetical protein JXR76_25435 [Deltaproteobacteria bacterium]|nr:hypothetical protein [Deltaproteobacteria bacterium]
MVKKRKVKKGSEKTGRSASAANRIAKQKKETFVKRPSLATPKDEERKAGLGVLKVILGVLAAAIIGATILAKYTGAGNVEHGDKIQDEPCVGNEECATGYVCYQYATNPFSCKERCKEDDDCGERHTCKAVVRFGKKRVKPMKVCVANREL